MEIVKPTLQAGLSKLKQWYDSEEKTLRCTLPFQRRSGVWNGITKSNLVASILTGSYVPPIVLLRNSSSTDSKGKDVYFYEILDGQQRLTNMFSFMEDGWSLHEETPSIAFDGFEYDIAGRKFSELEEELQSVIKQFKFSLQIFDHWTLEEAEALFFNINNGVALSSVQKSKAKMGSDMILYFGELLRGTFFSEAVHITEAQAKREENLLMLIQSVILMDNRLDGVEYKSIAAAYCQKYAADLRNNYGEEHRRILRETIEYLDKAFGSKNKFLRKNNVPVVVMIARIALERGIPAKDFKLFINEFANEVYYSYDSASGSGNVKARQVQMRLRIMFIVFCKHFGLDIDEVPKPFADNIPLWEGVTAMDGLLPEGAEENQKIDGDTSISVESAEDNSENPAGNVEELVSDGEKAAGEGQPNAEYAYGEAS